MSNDHGFGRIFHILLDLKKNVGFFIIFLIFFRIFWLFDEFLLNFDQKFDCFPAFISGFYHFFCHFFIIYLWFSNFFYPGRSYDHGFGCIFDFLLHLEKNVTKITHFLHCFRFFCEFFLNFVFVSIFFLNFFMFLDFLWKVFHICWFSPIFPIFHRFLFRGESFPPRGEIKNTDLPHQ